jgi:hydrogenase large subunit
VKIRNGKIDTDQRVVPTTWNESPREHVGQIGAFEASPMNTPLAKADQPPEILRTIHARCPPCLACSTRVMSP